MPGRPRRRHHRSSVVVLALVALLCGGSRAAYASSVPRIRAVAGPDRTVVITWSVGRVARGTVGWRIVRRRAHAKQTTSMSAPRRARRLVDLHAAPGTTYLYRVCPVRRSRRCGRSSRVVTAHVPSLPASFGTLPSHARGLPRSDYACAVAVARGSHPERRPENAVANHTKPHTPVPWARDEGSLYWTRWIANRNRVTGGTSGTTDALLAWGACKWGLDENVLRAVASQESDWHQSMVSDFAGGVFHSFGIMQVHNTANDGGPAFGGYPETARSTALNVDFYGAYIRSCLDGAFYDGGPWLYGGLTIDALTARDGAASALWGCVGSWYSGDWYDAGARDYIANVQRVLAQRLWMTY